jgi:hypothetical protein
VELAQIRPISIILIAVVKTGAVGRDAKRKHLPELVSTESRIANGLSIQLGSMVINFFIRLSETSKTKVFMPISTLKIMLKLKIHSLSKCLVRVACL